MEEITGASTKDKYVSAGMLRHLPYPLTWTKCFGGTCPASGVYQNGAYWSTPLPYLVRAAGITGHASFAQGVVAGCIGDFMAHGIYEDVDYGRPVESHGVLNYTASATNALWAARYLEQA